MNRKSVGLWAAIALLCCEAAQAGLEVSVLGKAYRPGSARVSIQQKEANQGGSTSVRNEEPLEWKEQGYFQRNRDLGQVFTPEQTFHLESIVLRTGPSDNAVLAGTPGAKLFVQFFEVTGTPKINDNGTAVGSRARHGFSANHRCDDFLEGVQYKSLRVVRGGEFPAVPPTKDAADMPVSGDAGKLVYLRWTFTGADRLTFQAGKRYAFMVGFETPGKNRGFTLANANAAGANAPPSLADKHDRYHGGWGLRREGNGAVPPVMIPGGKLPDDPSSLNDLRLQSLFKPGEDRYKLSPTTDGYPDVDTYRDHEFYLETSAPAP